MHDPITRLTAARFDGPQALYTEAVRLLSERPAPPDDLADLVARLRKVSADARADFSDQWADAQYTGERPDLEPITAELAVELVEDAADAIEALSADNARLSASEPQCAVVKPLVWEPSINNKPWHSAKAPWGWYYAQWDDKTEAWFASLEMGEVEAPIILQPSDVQTIDAAKAAAQADYEARILSAITMRPEAEVRAEAWAAALEAAALKMAKGGLYTVWDRSEAIRTLTPLSDISAAMDRIKAEEYARGLADGMLRGGADAAKAIADAKAGWMQQFSDVRTWFHYPIVMPLKDGSGPASDAECDTITWEVWDELLNSHASFDNLPDAINEAMRLNNAITEVRK